MLLEQKENMIHLAIAERAGCIDAKPLVYAHTVEMVIAGKSTQFTSIFIGRKANATFLKYMDYFSMQFYVFCRYRSLHEIPRKEF
ncbi:hypothetical protein NC653_032700 [Populus alba x Populus x berolinensis]|uniref:Uncharacterized protein n=1 Tax=Populus alba x Populus x berolinensis TaxID=444605 RepID=A0AAD6LUU6_9ROSI|nr:hypothetical protein NC653_032700 [Populus alba x Populus x berolinensis]